MTTTRDLVEASPIANETYDYALPHQWVDDVKHVTNVYPVGHFVWWYKPASIYGEPYPLTPYAAYLLMCYKMKVYA